MNQNENMEAMINSLLEADAAAQDKLRETQQRRQQMADTMAQVREDIQRDYGDRAQQRIEAIRAQHRAEFDTQMQGLEASYQAALAELQKNYETHREEWIDTLVARCLS